MSTSPSTYCNGYISRQRHGGSKIEFRNGKIFILIFIIIIISVYSIDLQENVGSAILWTTINQVVPTYC